MIGLFIYMIPYISEKWLIHIQFMGKYGYILIPINVNVAAAWHSGKNQSGK